MYFWLIKILIFSTIVNQSMGLHCWVCENAKGEADCRKKGYLKKCNHDEQACQVELRHHAGWKFGPMITKRCKQALACDNNFIQNKRTAWWPTQCNPKFPTNSVCRCCCDHDNCNYLGLKCWDGPTVCSPPHTSPQFGSVQCSNDANVDSECFFGCKKGFRIVGSETSTCTADLEWDQPAPKCIPEFCIPLKQPPKYGHVICTNYNNIGSKCNYECEEGFIMIGPDKTTCQNDGQWSHSAPRCEPIKCLPEHTKLDNGDVDCSNRMYIGSMCTFSCEIGFALIGSEVSNCLDDGNGDGVGKWDFPAPNCRPIKCFPPQSNPAHGVVDCTDDNSLHSVCDFSCLTGFALQGGKTTSCLDDGNRDTEGFWSRPAPVCLPIRCQPPHNNPENGVVQCSQNNFLGSICTFVCEDRYSLVGSSTSVCIKGLGATGQWSQEQPTCKPITCPDGPGTPVNGHKVCTNGNILGSICEFACNEYHNREGALFSTCVSDNGGFPYWDQPVPQCNPNTCKNQTLPHGNVECSNDNLATSTCTFHCIETDYELYPPETESNICLNSTIWDRPQPCCARACPPYALMDLVIILDSSSSISLPNWDSMIKFVQGFVGDFMIGDDATYFGIFRYNRYVDEDTQIMLNSNVNTTQVIADIASIPYDGSGTYTGNAISHAVDVILAKENGNREEVKDVVLVITDGKSQDDVSEPAARLRATGAAVYALPINPPRGQLDMDQVLQITGDESTIIKDATVLGFAALTAEFSVKLGKEICGNPCTHVRHNHD